MPLGKKKCNNTIIEGRRFHPMNQCHFFLLLMLKKKKNLPIGLGTEYNI